MRAVRPQSEFLTHLHFPAPYSSSSMIVLTAPLSETSFYSLLVHDASVYAAIFAIYCRITLCWHALLRITAGDTTPGCPSKPKFSIVYHNEAVTLEVSHFSNTNYKSWNPSSAYAT